MNSIPNPLSRYPSSRLKNLSFALHKFPQRPLSFSIHFLCFLHLIHFNTVKVKGRRRNMNRRAYQYHQQQQNAAALVGFGCVAELRRCENCSNSFSMANSNGLVCPRPRRFVNFNEPISIRPSSNQPMESCESKAGIELLDLIRTQGDYGGEKSSFPAALSPPFYSGSPPVRASNPLIQDEQFGNEKLSPLSPPSSCFEPPQRSGSPPSSRKSLIAGGVGGGRVRPNYRHNQPPVRVEGFNCSVYAIA